MSEQQSQDTYIAGEISRRLASTYCGQRRWSLWTHGTTILIVLCSSVAAVLDQAHTTADQAHVDFVVRFSLVTILSLVVTVVSAVQAKLSFEKKWIANRMTRSAIEQLQIDQRMGVPAEELAKSLKQILARHDEAITTA